VAATGFTREQVDELRCVERRARGLDESVGPSEAGATVADRVADPCSEDGFERVVDQVLIDQLPDLWAQLGERQRKIIFARFGLGGPAQTLREIGDDLGLSAERVRQLEGRALQDARHVLGLH
jgi:DNA-directed RNA polymerase sigma subunit (sigma70/sigma32)